ncbi:MAG: hypothetical protein ABH883_00615, partial [Candidatus Omnitrophota bacterium]
DTPEVEKLYEDSNGNVFGGKFYGKDCRNSCFYSNRGLIAGIELENVTVIWDGNKKEIRIFNQKAVHALKKIVAEGRDFSPDIEKTKDDLSAKDENSSPEIKAVYPRGNKNILDMTENEFLELHNPKYAEISKHMFADWEICRVLAKVFDIKEYSVEWKMLRAICLSHDIAGVLGYRHDEKIEERLFNLADGRIERAELKGKTGNEIIRIFNSHAIRLRDAEKEIAHAMDHAFNSMEMLKKNTGLYIPEDVTRDMELLITKHMDMPKKTDTEKWSPRARKLFFVFLIADVFECGNNYYKNVAGYYKHEASTKAGFMEMKSKQAGFEALEDTFRFLIDIKLRGREDMLKKVIETAYIVCEGNLSFLYYGKNPEERKKIEGDLRELGKKYSGKEDEKKQICSEFKKALDFSRSELEASWLWEKFLPRMAFFGIGDEDGRINSGKKRPEDEWERDSAAAYFPERSGINVFAVFPETLVASNGLTRRNGRMVSRFRWEGDKDYREVQDKPGPPYYSARKDVPLAKDLLDSFRKQNPEYDVLGYVGNSHVLANPNLISWVRLPGGGHNLYGVEKEKERIREGGSRVYPSLVLYQDGSIEIEEVKITADERVLRVYEEDPGRIITKDITDRINLVNAGFGLIKKNKDYNLSENYQYDYDVRHYINFPYLYRDNGGISFGLSYFYTDEGEVLNDRVEKAIKGDVISL